MSEAGDFDPGPWTGHDFKSARKNYDVHLGRSYNDAITANTVPEDMVPGSIATESRAPLVIACDVTGSMGQSPATIFSKCPYLDIEGKEYLGDDMEISFAAVGDAYTDKYPLQVRPFAKGLELKDRLKELIIEGAGGGQARESYDLPALYYSRNVEMPNAINPIFIYIGDEGLYDLVNKTQASLWAHTTLKSRISYKTVLKELKQRYALYIIRQPYHKSKGDEMSDADKKIHAQWAGALGEDHVAFLPDAARVVDVIFGILAKETGRIDYFKEEIKGRQSPDQVKTALKGLKSIHALPAPDSKDTDMDGKSITMNKTKGKKSKSLL